MRLRKKKKIESLVFIIASQSTRNPIVTPPPLPPPPHCKRRCKKTRETEEGWNNLSPFPVKEDRPWRLLENCLCVCARQICEKFSSHTWTLYIRGGLAPGWTGQDSGVGVINCHDFIHDFSSPKRSLTMWRNVITSKIAWLMRGKNCECVVFIKWSRVSEVN